MGALKNGWPDAIGHRQESLQADSGVVEGVRGGLTEMERQMETGPVKRGEGLLQEETTGQGLWINVPSTEEVLISRVAVPAIRGLV